MPEIGEHTIECPACEGRGWTIAGFGSVVSCKVCGQSGKILLKPGTEIGSGCDGPWVDPGPDAMRFYW